MVVYMKYEQISISAYVKIMKPVQAVAFLLLTAHKEMMLGKKKDLLFICVMKVV